MPYTDVWPTEDISVKPGAMCRVLHERQEHSPAICWRGASKDALCEVPGIGRTRPQAIVTAKSPLR